MSPMSSCLFLNAKLSSMASPSTIKTHFELQHDEFITAQKLTSRSLPRKVKWAIWVRYGLLLGLMLTGIAYEPNGKLQSVSVIVLVQVWLVFVAGGVARRGLVDVQFAQMRDSEMWYEFDRGGFRCGMPNAESSLGWPAITANIETDKLFVLITGVLFYTVPKRALAAEDINALKQLLAESLPAGRS